MKKIIEFKKFKKSALELHAQEVVKNLNDAGFEAYFAGGAVRDMILNKEPKDIDIATSAKPDEIERVFSKTFEKGKAFGVVVVKIDDFEFEVATFRKDIGVFDHRRPEKVEYSSAEEDAKRRDFTINGLFFDPLKSEVVDYVDGLKDIESKTIRFIGSPEKRIEEDYLRMLRAVRFSSQLGFLIEKESKQAIEENASKITEISQERIRDEFTKILTNSNRALGLEELRKFGLLKYFLPELEETRGVLQPSEFHSEGDVWTHILLALSSNKDEISVDLAWAILLHDIAKPQTIGERNEVGKTRITFFEHDVKSAEKAVEILKRFKFSSAFIDKINWAILQHMRIIHAFRGMSERKQKKLFLDSNINLLLDLTKADLSASLRPGNKIDLSMYEDAVQKKKHFDSILSSDEKKQIKKFDLVTGRDIMNLLNLKPGPEVGKIKKDIEMAYLEGKINSKKDALAMLSRYK